PVRRLGALGVFVVEDAERLRERLRLANAEYERLASMAQTWWRVTAGPSGRGAGAFIYRLRPPQEPGRLLLASSRAPPGAADRSWRALATLRALWSPPVFPLRAADFIARGVERGPKLGGALRTAEAAWITAGFPSDRATLSAIAEAAIAGSEGSSAASVTVRRGPYRGYAARGSADSPAASGAHPGSSSIR